MRGRVPSSIEKEWDTESFCWSSNFQAELWKRSPPPRQFPEGHEPLKAAPRLLCQESTDVCWRVRTDICCVKLRQNCAGSPVTGSQAGRGSVLTLESRGCRLGVSSFHILEGKGHRDLEALSTQEEQGGEELVASVLQAVTILDSLA